MPVQDSFVGMSLLRNHAYHHDYWLYSVNSKRNQTM